MTSCTMHESYVLPCFMVKEPYTNPGGAAAAGRWPLTKHTLSAWKSEGKVIAYGEDLGWPYGPFQTTTPPAFSQLSLEIHSEDHDAGCRSISPPVMGACGTAISGPLQVFMLMCALEFDDVAALSKVTWMLIM